MVGSPGVSVGYALSLALPVLTHVTRQSMACAAAFPQYAFTGFLATYALTMLALAPLIQARAQLVLRVALPLFAGTFAASVALRARTAAFVAAWVAHAVPSAVLWPIAFQYVHEQSRSKFHLAVWSLQGNVGDFLGCLYPAFAPAASSLGFVLASALFGGAVVACACAARDVRTDDRLLPIHAPPVSASRTGVLVVATSALKTATYYASDFLPPASVAGTSGYRIYNAASLAGVVGAGVACENNLSYACVWGTATGIGIVSLMGQEGVGDPHAVLACLGALHSACSTTLSICICTQVAAAQRSFGRLTSVLDGAGSLVAAGAQLVPKTHLASLQLGCAAVCWLAVSVLCVLETRHSSSPSATMRHPSDARV